MLQDDAVVISADLDGCRLQVLLDSGADVSCLSSDCWSRLGLPYTLRPSSVSHGITANDTALEFKGRVRVPITISDVTVNHDFYVCNGLTQDCLLGKDFMKAHRGVLDDAIPVPVNAVSVTEKIRIPKYSECDVMCRLPRTNTTVGTVIFDPMEGLPGEVVAGSSVSRVSRENRKLYVRLVNLTEHDVILKRGSIVGHVRKILPNYIREIRQPKNDCVPPNTQKQPLKFPDYDRKLLNAEQEKRMDLLFDEYRDIFSQGSNDIGQTDIVEHSIDTTGHEPIKAMPRRVPMHQQEKLDNMIVEMENNRVIQKSESAWASPIVLAPKKDGTLRFCVDFRAVNDITRKDAYPLPRIDDILESLQGVKYFCHLDLASGYWQVRMAEKDREKTAFCVPGGLWEFLVMPFGLTNAPPTFQRLMNTVLQNHLGVRALVYLDDIIIWGRTMDEMIDNLELIFESLRNAKLKLKPSKCKLFRTTIDLLGHVVSENGISTDPAKTCVIDKWPVPKKVSDVRTFLGTTSYYRRFIKNFSEIAQPLTRLTQKDIPFRWAEDEQRSFTSLKTLMTSSPVLGFPTAGGTFVLDTDASNNAIGAVLSQYQDGESLDDARVIAYGSKTLSASERNYDTRRKELLAVVHFLNYFRYYLEAKPFHLRTDHQPLKSLLSRKSPLSSQEARWAQILWSFPIVNITYREGCKHGNADGMSRHPYFATSEPEESETEKSGPAIDKRDYADVVDYGIRRIQAHIDDLPWQLEQLPKLQRDDSLLGYVRLAISEDPTAVDKIGPYKNVLSNIELEDDILFLKATDQFPKRLLVTQEMGMKLLPTLHDSIIAGHLGFRRTLKRARDRVFWPGMTKDISEYLQKCTVCQKSKNKHQMISRAPLVQDHSPSKPFDRVAFDVLGPLPESVNGNRYILVVQDYFSKWAEAYPLPHQKAELIATTLLNQWISRYGTPGIFHSDQGTNFESDVVQELFRILGIRKTRTTPYHPQSDGMVERLNATIEQMLRCYVAKNQRDWDEKLPLVMSAYRSSVHATTQQTPYSLLHGTEYRLPIDLIIPNTGCDVTTSNEFVKRMKKRLATSYKAVREATGANMKIQKRCYDRKSTMRHFANGDLILLFNKQTPVGVSRKLMTAWDGPWTVKRQRGVCLEIRNPTTGKEKTVHINDVKPFKLSENDKSESAADVRVEPTPVDVTRKPLTIRRSKKDQNRVPIWVRGGTIPFNIDSQAPETDSPQVSTAVDTSETHIIPSIDSTSPISVAESDVIRHSEPDYIQISEADLVTGSEPETLGVSETVPTDLADVVSKADYPLQELNDDPRVTDDCQIIYKITL
jgi:transposase InsO family protein